MDLDNRTILVTGAAGFIGAFLSEALLRQHAGVHVIGIDSMNDYYEVSLKEYRLERLEKLAAERAQAGCRFSFVRGNLADRPALDALFAQLALIDTLYLYVAMRRDEAAVNAINRAEKALHTKKY